MLGQLMGLGTGEKPAGRTGAVQREAVKRRRGPRKVSRFRGRRNQRAGRRGNLRPLRGLLGSGRQTGTKKPVRRTGRVNRRGQTGAERGTVGPKRNNLHQIAAQLRGAY